MTLQDKIARVMMLGILEAQVTKLMYEKLEEMDDTEFITSVKEAAEWPMLQRGIERVLKEFQVNELN